MYSGNAPQSFAPGGMSAFDHDQFQPTTTVGAQPTGFQNTQLWPTGQIQATGDGYSQPPSQGDMGHRQESSNNQLLGLTGYRGLGQGQPTVNVDKNKAPSLTEFGPGQGSSYNQDPNRSGGLSGGSYGYGGQPPSHGDIRAGGVSQTSDDHVDGYSKEGKAPGLSDVDRRGSSETGAAEIVNLDGPDAQDFVGISLVGKNFRKFYPNAYYREPDEEN